MTITSFKSGLQRIRRAWRAGRATEALALVDQLLTSWPDNPALLVLRAEVIQSSDADGTPTLAEAKRDLARAVDLDPESVDPLLELGHFELAVEDDPEKAVRYFDQAVALCERQLREALTGKAKALAELKRTEEAPECLAKAFWLQSHNGKNGSVGKEILRALDDLRSPA